MVIGYGKDVPGGYNGGGDGFFSSGGGYTDIRAIEDTLFHRILVAGGGGASDNSEANDGIGGSAGGLTAQSFWVAGRYNSKFEAEY